jgi:hypothetical protein
MTLVLIRQRWNRTRRRRGWYRGRRLDTLAWAISIATQIRRLRGCRNLEPDRRGRLLQMEWNQVVVTVLGQCKPCLLLADSYRDLLAAVGPEAARGDAQREMLG